jgi:nucleoside-triphosphatase THEP1
MIAHIPDFKTAVRNPVSIINQVLLHGEERLSELKSRSNPMPKVSLICGAVGSGKSTYAQTVANLLTERKLRVGGILSLRLTNNDETTGYDLLDLSTNVTEKFLRFGKVPGKEQIGRFSIFPEGIEKGIRTLERATHDKFDLVIVDEVGRLELRGDGWSDILKKLIEMPETPLLITVREGLEQEIIDKWHISDYEIVNVELTDPLRLAERISQGLLN